MITTFNSAASAFDFFKENSNTGFELSFNDEVYFGVGFDPYCWTELVAGLIPQKGPNPLFTHLTDEELMMVLCGLLHDQGVIWVDDYSDDDE